MTFYLSVFFCCVLLAGMADLVKKWYGAVFVFSAVLLLSFVGGVRDIGIGTDTTVYSENYFYDARYISSLGELLELDTEKSKGYLLLNLVGIGLSDRLWVSQFVVQFFTHGLILFSAWLMRERLRLRMFLFALAYCCVFYNQTYNFMRQYCAMALLFLSLYFVVAGRWKCYAVCQACAFFFHPTSLLFVLVPVLYYACVAGKGDRWRFWLVGYCLLAVLVTAIYYYDTVNILKATGYDFAKEYVGRYGKSSQFDGREGMRKTLVSIMAAVFYFIYKAYRRKLIGRDLVVLMLSIHLSFIAFYLISYYSIYLYRLSLYFYLPMILFVTSLVGSKKVLPVERAGWICLLLLDWYNYVVRHDGAESFPYHSAILGI